MSGSDDPEHAGRDQAGRFTKGQSGNASGRPRGVRDRATVAAEILLAGEAKALTRKAIELALQGDTVALRMCLDRIAPVRKPRVYVDLPEMHELADLPHALAAVTRLIADGQIAPEEGAAIASVFEQQRRSIELIELTARIAALEALNGK